MIKNVDNIQDKLIKIAKKKMDEDFEEFSKKFYNIFTHGIYREHLKLRQDDSAVMLGLDRGELMSHLKKVFVEQRTTEYINTETKNFMNKFNQMSEQFDEMIGFCDDEENH